MSCLFCDIVEKKIPADVVFESEWALAFRDIRPVAPVHVLVIPRRHVKAASDLTDSDETLIGRVMLTATKVAASMGLEPSGYRLVVNNGSDAGQSVDHVHVHILGGRALGWPPG